MNFTQRKRLSEDVNRAAEQVMSGLSPEEIRQRRAAGAKRREAVEATAARSYRSLIAVANDGKDKAERRDG